MNLMKENVVTKKDVDVQTQIIDVDVDAEVIAIVTIIVHNYYP